MNFQSLFRKVYASPHHTTEYLEISPYTRSLHKSIKTMNISYLVTVKFMNF